jgi:hypothetical protein
MSKPPHATSPDELAPWPDPATLKKRFDALIQSAVPTEPLVLALGAELQRAGLSELIDQTIEGQGIVPAALRALLYAAARCHDEELSPKTKARVNDRGHVQTLLGEILQHNRWGKIRGELVKFSKRALRELEERTPAQGGAGTGQGDSKSDPSLTPATVEEFVFAPSGNGYTIKGFRESGHLTGLKGLKVIALLIQTPDKPVLMQELAGADARMKADRRSPQKVLDGEAQRKLWKRRCEWRADLDRAREENDTVEADVAEREIGEIDKQLAQGLGLGGKDRDLNNPYDKLRSLIHRRLKAVHKAMRNAKPPMRKLADHFELHIASEASKCFVYRPGPGQPPWATKEK